MIAFKMPIFAAAQRCDQLSQRMLEMSDVNGVVHMPETVAIGRSDVNDYLS